jgi:uncharacterized protein (TIGR02270 family)
MVAFNFSNPLPHVVAQHVEEAAHLAQVRHLLARAPHVRLEALRRADLRLAAHLDGVEVAGEFGWGLCESALQAGDPGGVFVASVRAIEDDHPARIDKMLSLGQALPAARQGLGEAFNWVSAQWLQGLIQQMLESSSTVKRMLGIVACTAHRADPAAALQAAMRDADASLRACGLRAAGESGRIELRAACLDALAHVPDDTPEFSFWAARSAALLGERQAVLAPLQAFATRSGPWREGALALLLKWLPLPECGRLLKHVSEDPAGLRDMLNGIGVAGDPRFVPWLIDRMREPELARLAGETFAMITGCDMSSAGFILQASEGEESAKVDEAGDVDYKEKVALDEDEAQPLPDADKVATWWSVNAWRFAPGTRYFVGAPPSLSHCRAVLRSGYQRQRMAAAEHLCILQPGMKLFNTAAPAWRQQRWLDETGA